MEQIVHLRQELARKRKMAEESLRKSKSASGYMKARSALPLTKPEEFAFATDSRIKADHGMQLRGGLKDFASGLRHHPASPVSVDSVEQVRHGLTRLDC